MAIVGEPGTNKSSCLEFAIEPLRKIDRDNLKTYKKKLKQYEATKNDPDKATEPPVYGQIVLSDITVEGFLKQHLNTPRGFAIYADELMGFVKSFSLYCSGNDEEVWTQLFTGVPIIVNRLLLRQQPLRRHHRRRTTRNAPQIRRRQDRKRIHLPMALRLPGQTHIQRLDQDSHLQETRLRNLRKTLKIT